MSNKKRNNFHFRRKKLLIFTHLTKKKIDLGNDKKGQRSKFILFIYIHHVYIYIYIYI